MTNYFFHIITYKYKSAIVLFLFCFSFVFTVSGQTQEEHFNQVKDSLVKMLHESWGYNNKGDFVKGDEYIEKTLHYLNHIRKDFEEDGYLLDSIEYEILNSQAWNKTLLKKYSLAETLYKNLINKLPATSHIKLSNAYTGISSLYGMQKEYALSEKYAIKALDEALIAQDNKAAFHAQSNLGDIYFETEQYERALEKYLEVRRLSVVIGKNEAISLGNLAMAYAKAGKQGIADQYFQESLALSKEDAPVVYSIILPAYCELLIDIGEKKKARKLILEAVRDSRYTQMSEYNLKYIDLLAKLYPSDYTSYFIAGGIILFIILGLLCWRLWKEKQNVKSAEERNKKLQNEIKELEESQTEPENSNTSQENIVQLIGFFEAFPQVHALINKIKLKPENKTEISAAAKELSILLAPFTSQQIEKEMAYYIEQSNTGFYDKLKNNFPQLSLTDLRLCTLIKMGMNTKEIASITNKSVRGIESAKFRLRKKMNIEGNKDIYDYLLELEKVS